MNKSKIFISYSVALLLLLIPTKLFSQIPDDYKGKPFADSLHKSGAQQIPGRVELALYDLGGEGIAYHDIDSTNNGSGVLNKVKDHQRPDVPLYICFFRENEGVDISYTKDFADFNHTNLFEPTVNQLYLGWQNDGEWTNYTVNVNKAGKYKIIALYGYRDNKSSLWLNNVKAVDLLLPVDTGDWHHWNKAEVGTIVFPVKGMNLLTLHYNKGSNLAYFDFELIEEIQN
jgi:hypothetical protein